MRRILPVVGVVVLVLVLGFVVLGSCSGSSKADAYRSYVQDVNSVASQSNRDAKALDAALYNQELTPDQVTARVATLHRPGARDRDDGERAQADRQDQAAGAPALPAAGAAVPHARRSRSSPTRSRPRSPPRPTTAEQRRNVAAAYSALIASDAIYAASFQRPAQELLKEEKVTDAAIQYSSGAARPSSRTRRRTATASGSTRCETPARRRRARRAPSAPRSTA